MSDAIGTGKAAKPNADVCPRMTMEELKKLPVDSPILDTVLPDWVTRAFLRHLETGEGDPWGGYFDSRPDLPGRTRP